MNVNLKLNLQSQKELLESLQAENLGLRSEIEQIKAKLKRSQTGVSFYKKKLEFEKQAVRSLIETCEKEKESDVITLRCEKGNKFKDSVRLGYMDLQGKANVAASKCSEVVQIVAKHIFGREFSLEELPSCSSILNFADEAHHIAKFQVADEIVNSKHFTMASDGTSRQKRQYIERHIVLDNKLTLSVGFSEVASEDAKTLLEGTLEVLDELSCIYSCDQSAEQERIFKEIISKMKCLMSDRASVNKLFNRQMSEYRAQYLGDEDVVTHFLYCNAHVLLGMARGTESAIKEVEKGVVESEGVKLGRDSQKSFGRFSSSSEASAVRLIRLASDCFGPRCDEKSGSRAEWLAYCSSQNIISKFTSFRSNRFNNLFENAAALLFHHQHIADFLENYCSHSNLKLQSISADVSDQKILAVVGAIALFNVAISDSYWKLMNSSTPYGAFPKYAKQLDSALDEYAHKTSIDVDSITSVFDDFPSQDESTKLFLKSSPRPDVWTSAFLKISLECHTVVKRQLADFLGGVFDGPLEDDVQEILDSCPLTNLCGERLFGDFDYDMLKRRNATTHHRSSIIMWNHNKTSMWLDKQGVARRSKIMTAAQRNRSDLRQKHREQTRKVREVIVKKLIENRKRKEDKELKTAEAKAALLDAIIAQGGVCKSKQQLDALYRDGTAEDLKIQIRYRKVFLSKKHLRVSGSVRSLYSSLLRDIRGEAEQADNSGSDSDHSSPSEKRLKIDSSSDSEESENEESER